MKRSNKEVPAGVYVYACFNLTVLIIRFIAYGVAIWTAVKPGGSWLAGILMAILASAMKTRSYTEDLERHGYHPAETPDADRQRIDSTAMGNEAPGTSPALDMPNAVNRPGNSEGSLV